MHLQLTPFLVRSLVNVKERNVPLEVAVPLGQAALIGGAALDHEVLDGAGILDQLGLGIRRLHDGQAKGHTGGAMSAGRNGDDGVACLGCDLRGLGNLGRDKETSKPLAAKVEGIINALAALGLDKVESLEVSLVLNALGGERGEEAVLARVKGRVAEGPGVAALGAVVVVVELDNVLERTDVGVLELGEVGLDVVVEIDLDDCVLGLVGVAAVGAPVPVPPGSDEGLIVGDLGAVDDDGAGLGQVAEHRLEDAQLLRVGVMPEAVPGNTEDGALESARVGQELCVTALRGHALLSQRVVVTLVHAVDGVQSVGGIADGAAERANRVKMLTLGNDTGPKLATWNGGK